MNESASSIYDRVGGQDAIAMAVELFYAKVVTDPRVSKYFENIKLSFLRRHQEDFLAYAFGGPSNYNGRSLRDAHRRLDISEHEFDIVANHLESTLVTMKVDPDLINDIMNIVATTKNDVLDR